MMRQPDEEKMVNLAQNLYLICRKTSITLTTGHPVLVDKSGSECVPDLKWQN
jgi:hypothetical protein